MTPVSRRLRDFHSLLNCISYEYTITNGILINGPRNAAVHTCAWHCRLFIAEHFWPVLTALSLYKCGHRLFVCKGDSNESLCGVFDVLTVLLWVTITYTTRNTLARNRWFKSADEQLLVHRRKEPLIYGVFFRSTLHFCLVIRVYVFPSVFCVSVQSSSIAKDIAKYL